MIASHQYARFVIPTPPFDFVVNRLFFLWMCFLEITEFLAQEADVVVNLNHSAISGKLDDHVVSHVRAASQIARHEECDANTGAFVVARTS